MEVLLSGWDRSHEHILIWPKVNEDVASHRQINPGGGQLIAPMRQSWLRRLGEVDLTLNHSDAM